jgi:phosphoribosylaminoimidazolecarboxamide formyltransferase / IMP cyclohydrolase
MADTFTAEGINGVELKYGENHYQAATLYTDPNNTDPLALTNFALQDGSDKMSRTNVTDVDSLLQAATHIAAGFELNGLAIPKIALGCKHGNMCGGAVSDSPEKVVKDMLDGDPLSIHGGATMVNFPIDGVIAEALLRYNIDTSQMKFRLLDVVTAPSADDEAIGLMQRKGGKLRTAINPALGELTLASLDTAPQYRSVRGSVVTQDNYTAVLDFAHEAFEGTHELTEELKRDILLAWAIGCTSNSNTITLVKDGQLIGNAVGQQDRVGAADLAKYRTERSGHSMQGAVAYSDSFFPFPDGPQLLADAGISNIFTSRRFPASERDAIDLAPFTDAGIGVFTLPDNIIRGFAKH